MTSAEVNPALANGAATGDPVVMPAWTCTGCGVVVEHDHPITSPQYMCEPDGRTSLTINGKVVHQCEPDTYGLRFFSEG